MMEVIVVGKPDLHGKRLSFALAEDRVGHYPEFRDFFVRTFDLDQKGLTEPGYVQAPSGLVYALIFIGRSGEPFPSGVEMYALVEALELWVAKRSIATYGPFCAGWLARLGRLGRLRTSTEQGVYIVYRPRRRSECDRAGYVALSRD